MIGNVSGPGGQGPIKDVRLAASYDAAAGDESQVQITLTPSTTPTQGPYSGFDDPGAPIIPFFRDFYGPGTIPVLGPLDGSGGDFTGTDGKTYNPYGVPQGDPLPNHGVYGENTVWQEFYLGHLDQTDSPVADFIGSFPDPNAAYADAGQINVYEVSVLTTLVHPLKVHFDVYDSIEGRNRAKFAPFSHTGGGDANIVPGPAAIILLVSGLAAVVPACRPWKRLRVR